jgi:hypothetical protein
MFGRAVEPELRTVEVLFAEAERLIRSMRRTCRSSSTSNAGTRP